MTRFVRIDPKALAAARVARAMSVTELARRAGVGERTIRRREREGGEVERSTARLLATALGKSLESLLAKAPRSERIARSERADKPEKAARSEPAKSSAAAKSARRAWPPRLSHLDATVHAEAKAGAPEIALGDGLVLLGAKGLRALFSFAKHHAGRRFVVRGRVDRSDEASDAECRELGVEAGDVVRFLVVREVAPGWSLAVTVHAGGVEMVEELLDRVPVGEVDVVVVVALGAPVFRFFGVGRERPWALWVMDVV